MSIERKNEKRSREDERPDEVDDIKASKWIIVFTDPGSYDPDDLLALMMLKVALDRDPNLWVLCVATHFRAQARAEIVDKLISHERFVIAASVEQNEETFREGNPGWPHIFGDPYSSGAEGQPKQWYPKFGEAFKDLPRNQRIHSIRELFRVLGHACSRSNPARVLLLSPLEEASILLGDNFKDRIGWYAMGGCQSDGKAGYNWGLYPEETLRFQADLAKKKTFVTCVTSAMGRECQFPLEMFNAWCLAAKTPRQRALMAEWINSNRGNALAQHKNMCDPLAVWVALNDEEPISGQIGEYAFDRLDGSYLDNRMQWKSGQSVFIPALDMQRATREILVMLQEAFDTL